MENIEETAKAWLHNPGRPRASCEVLRQWHALLDKWVDDKDMPLLIRKSSMNRGSICKHASGRDVVPTDNSPANWSLSAAFEGIVPTLDEVMAGLRRGTVPVAMVLKKEEKEHAVFKGLLGQMKRPPSLNRLGWKVCHIDSVAGTHKRQRLDRRTVVDLRDEMRRFLDPNNMFVVHLKPGGATYERGEQIDFIRVFREARGKQAGL